MGRYGGENFAGVSFGKSFLIETAFPFGSSMRIALYHNLPSGGAKRHTYEQVKELARRGHELVEFAPSTADLSYCSFEPFIKKRHIFDLLTMSQKRRRIPLLTPYIDAVQGIRFLQRTAQVNQAIANEIDSGNFDLVFVKDCQIIMNPYVLRYLNTRTVYQCHHGLRHQIEMGQITDEKHVYSAEKIKDLYYRPAKKLFELHFKRDELQNIQNASLVLTNSKFSEQLLSKHYQVNSHVVYPGINTDLFRPLPVAKLDYVLCVGSLIYSKGYRFLVSALSLINSVYRPALFIAANSIDPVEERMVREMAAKLEVRIHIEQIYDDHRLVQVYNEAKVFVYAPIQEALGMAALEAMACGTPVVAVAEGGIRETVLDGMTGWLVEREPSRFAEQVERILSDDEERLQFGQAGVEYVRKKWTWSCAVNRLEDEFGVG